MDYVVVEEGLFSDKLRNARCVVGACAEGRCIYVTQCSLHPFRPRAYVVAPSLIDLISEAPS